MSIAQDSSERSNMCSKIARLDEHVGPHAGHEFLFAYERAMTFDQRDEDLESTTAKVQRLRL
jgi:hypothetical protein